MGLGPIVSNSEDRGFGSKCWCGWNRINAEAEQVAMVVNEELQGPHASEVAAGDEV